MTPAWGERYRQVEGMEKHREGVGKETRHLGEDRETTLREDKGIALEEGDMGIVPKGGGMEMHPVADRMGPGLSPAGDTVLGTGLQKHLPEAGEPRRELRSLRDLCKKTPNGRNGPPKGVVGVSERHPFGQVRGSQGHPIVIPRSQFQPPATGQGAKSTS
ncbi:hypothetical protein KFL_001930035 [Klebsormidium nitens]|uniref:Uncharacterized protein n=1 Tax=Klebsormidium nitens TaxID=105231 RepID=A0A1Y1I0T7_KLENI|nr:hypothetical protein KFL_001930035 [Klebsormidium nitens]|eukprot:GAQ84525.1 hypothetical protein KFL_001930035 [Klebsormidium nitens]